LSARDFAAMLKPAAGLYDVKSIMDRAAFAEAGVKLWRL